MSNINELSKLTAEAKDDLQRILGIENSGGGSGGGGDASEQIFVVTFSDEVISGYNEIVADKTYDEIKDAYDNGKIIVANLETNFGVQINSIKMFMYYWPNNGFGAEYVQPKMVDQGSMVAPYTGIGSGIICYRVFIGTDDMVYSSSRTFNIS